MSKKVDKMKREKTKKAKVKAKAKAKREKTKKARMKRGREQTKKARMKQERGSENSRSPLRFVGNKRKLSAVLEEEPEKGNTVPRNTVPRNTVQSNTVQSNTDTLTSRLTDNYKTTYGRDISTSGKGIPWQAETKSSTHHALTVKMEHSKKRLDTIKLPSYVMKTKDYYKSVEDYIIDHYPFLRASPGKSPIVDAYDEVNECYVDIKVTTKYSAGKTVLTSSGQLKYLKDDNHNRGYYLIVRNTGGRRDIVDVELLFAAPEDEKYVEDKTHQYVTNLKKLISNRIITNIQ